MAHIPDFWHWIPRSSSFRFQNGVSGSEAIGDGARGFTQLPLFFHHFFIIYLQFFFDLFIDFRRCFFMFFFVSSFFGVFSVFTSSAVAFFIIFHNSCIVCFVILSMPQLQGVVFASFWAQTRARSGWAVAWEGRADPTPAIKDLRKVSCLQNLISGLVDCVEMRINWPSLALLIDEFLWSVNYGDL